MQLDIKDIADKADMIINGYAFTKEAGSAKFFVKSNGDTTVEKQGILSEREIGQTQAFIKEHYKEMYLKWQQLTDTGFYGEN